MKDRCLILVLRSTRKRLPLSLQHHVKRFSVPLRSSSTTTIPFSETSEKSGSDINFEIKGNKKHWHRPRHSPGTLISPRKQTTVYVRDPSKVTRGDILDALESFIYSEEGWAKEKARVPKAIVILATPSFATWLEDGSGFVEQILRRITQGLPWDEDFSRIKFDVLCACVDGLSPKPHRIPTSTSKFEGFSFLYGQSGLITPDLWGKQSVNHSLNSTLTFTSSARESCAVTLPLANTLFKTGKRSMLQASRWKLDSEDNLVKERGPFDKADIKIVIFQTMRCMQERVPTSYIPGIPLTPARAIVNGLGNIVRKLKFDNGLIGPASQELEASVDTALKSMEFQTTIVVWALVIPYEAVRKSMGTPNKLAMNPTELGNISSCGNSSDYIAHYIEKGATLCRVLSGGGGWGAKQGLLSLDPQATYNTVSEARFDFPDSTLEEQQTSALGNTAKEGDYIQFFTAQVSKTEADKAIYKKANLKYTNIDVKSSVIGAVPSTIDEVPGPLVDDTQQQKSQIPLIHIRMGHFGFVSESGMFLSRRNGDPIATKIDLPYSYFTVNHIIPDKRNRGFPESILRKVDPFGFPKID